MCQRQPWAAGAPAADRSAARAGQDARARENRDYVRALLRKKQPEFAAALELAYRELGEACRPVRQPGPAPGGRRHRPRPGRGQRDPVTTARRPGR